MYDLVGDKILEIFKADTVDISIVDRDAALLHVVYAIERRKRDAAAVARTLYTRQIALSPHEER